MYIYKQIDYHHITLIVSRFECPFYRFIYAKYFVYMYIHKQEKTIIIINVVRSKYLLCHTRVHSSGSSIRVSLFAYTRLVRFLLIFFFRAILFLLREKLGRGRNMRFFHVDLELMPMKTHYFLLEAGE